MKAKKVIAAVLSMAMITAGSISASATTVDFGGSTSGGTLGSTSIAGRIGTTSSGAYYTAVGFNTPDINGAFTMSVVGHLYITSAPSGGARTVNRTFSTYGGGILGKNIEISGAETSFPPNNSYGYVYSKVIVDAYYSSANHGSWSGSGQMDYTATPPASPVTDFGGSTSGGTLGSTNIAGRIGTTSSGAYYTVVGFNTPDISAPFTLNIVGHLYITSAPSGGARIVDRSFTSSGGGSLLGKDIERGGAETSYPPNNSYGYVYSKVIVDASYSSANHGSWSGSGQLNL